MESIYADGGIVPCDLRDSGASCMTCSQGGRTMSQGCTELMLPRHWAHLVVNSVNTLPETDVSYLVRQHGWSSYDLRDLEV